MHILTSLYIPFLWYLIGRRIDKRGERRADPLSKGVKALAVSAIAGLLLVGSLMVWSFAEGQRYTMSSLVATLDRERAGCDCVSASSLASKALSC